MGVSELLALGGVLVSIGGLVAWVNTLREEVKSLREWRHDVGDRPGYAALVRNEELDRRVTRIERALNGMLRNVPLDPPPPRV